MASWKKSWTAPRLLAAACVIDCSAQTQEIHLKTPTIFPAPSSGASLIRQ
jgi:hypothetical protein